MRLIFPITIGLFLLTHCGRSIQSAGGSSTAGNGIVAGMIRSTEGRPVTGASLYLYATTGELSAATAADSTLSDVNGSYTFNNVAPGTYSVFAKMRETVDVTALSKVEVLVDDEVEVEPMVLTKSTTVSGSLGFDVDSSWTVFVAVRGTPLTDTLEDLATFAIPDVPSGRYSLVLFAYTPISGDINCIAADTIEIVDGTQESPVILSRLSVLKNDKDTLLLDTFDDGNELLLNQRTTWWQYSDNATEPYDATAVTAEFAATPGWDGSGSCAHLTVTYDPDNSGAYAGFGCMVDNEVLSYHNLFTMEQLLEIRFRIRGTPVECDIVLFSPAFNAYNTIQVLDSVPEEWTQVVIHVPEAVDGMDEAGKDRWNTTGKWIEQITFNFFKRDAATKQAEFFIDDIIFIFNR